MTDETRFREILGGVIGPATTTETDPRETFRAAEARFAEKDHLGAIGLLERMLESGDNDTTEVRELLARAYYHSAQLTKAETAARLLLDRDPTHGYAAMLLTRTLERAGRGDDAARARRYAEALGERF